MKIKKFFKKALPFVLQSHRINFGIPSTLILKEPINVIDSYKVPIVMTDHIMKYSEFSDIDSDNDYRVESDQELKKSNKNKNNNNNNNNGDNNNGDNNDDDDDIIIISAIVAYYGLLRYEEDKRRRS